MHNLRLNRRTGIWDEEFFTIGEAAGTGTSYNPETGRSTVIIRMGYLWRAAVIHFGNGEVIVTAGGANHTAYRTTKCIDYRKRLIRDGPSLNVARWGHGGCAVGKDAFVCGGWDGSRLKSAEAYLRHEARWITLSSLIEQRNDVAVVGLPDRRVFCIGGENGGDSALSSVEGCILPVDVKSLNAHPQRRDGTSRVLPSFWRFFAPMRIGRCGHSAALFEGKIFVAGGWDSLSSAETFTIPTADNDIGQWTSLSTDMNEGRCWFTLVASPDKLYAFGNHHPPNNSVERLQRIGFDAMTNSSRRSSDRDAMSSEWMQMPPVSLMHRVWAAVSIPRAFL